jgi:peptidylprolyl isomerase
MRGPAALGVLRSVPAGIPVLNVAIVDAVARTGAREGVADLLPLLQGKEPALVCSAIQGVSTLARRYANDRTLVADVRRAILGTLALDDLAVSATAAETLADSLFRDREVVTALLATLGRLHLPNDIEAMQSVASALGKMGDTRALAPLQSLQRLPDRSVALAATEALRTLTGGDVALPPPPARPLLTSFDFAYLVGLPDTVHLSIETIRGTMQVDLYPLLAPFTVMNFLKLASERGFFRGRTFHRVVPNFVVQGGDPRGDGWGGPGYTIRSEFSPAGFEEGSVGMASAGKDTEGSQFFITQSPQPHLDGRYTVFGKLVAGTEVLDAIQIGDRILDVQWRR